MRLVAVAAIISLVLLTGCIEEPPGQNAGEDIKIGFLGPLSGPAAYTCEPVKKGFELAHSQRSMFDGRQIKLLFEDDKCQAGEAVKAARKFMEMDGISIVVSGVCSSSTLAIAPIAEEKEAILITPVSAAPSISEAGSHVFRISASSDLMASNAARIVWEKGFKKVGIVFELNDYPIGWNKAFREEFEGLGGQVLIEEGFNSGDKDIKTQFIKVDETKPEIILMTTLSATAAIQMLKQARELGIETQLLGNEAFSFKSVLEAAPNSTEGLLVTTYGYDLESEEMKQFLSDYRERYGKEATEEIYGALGYDLYNLLFEAIESCQGDNPECIKAFLENAGEIKGASGTFSLDEKGDGIREVVLKRVEDGKLKIIG